MQPAEHPSSPRDNRLKQSTRLIPRRVLFSGMSYIVRVESKLYIAVQTVLHIDFIREMSIIYV